MSIAIGDTRCAGIRSLFYVWAAASALCCTACAHSLKTSGADSGQGEVVAPLNDGRQESEVRDVSDKMMEQELLREEPVLPSNEVATDALLDADRPAARPAPDVPAEEKHPPEAITEAGRDEVPPVQRVTPKLQESPAGTDNPPAAPEPVTPEPEAAFGVDELINGLQQTKAIGVFTKLAIRSEALDLIDMVKIYRQSAAGITLVRLRSGFDGLLLKILALLDRDPELSRAIYQAREQLWTSLLEVKT